jgi:hypothetical protein
VSAPEREAVAGVVLSLRRAMLMVTDEQWAVLEPLVEAWTAASCKYS